MASSERLSDYQESKRLLLSIIMKKYGINDNDLHELSAVKVKLRV